MTERARERKKENETCLSCRCVPAELSLIKREIGSLHFPPLSLILLILTRRGIRHFSPLKKKQLVLVKWTKNRCARRYQNTHISVGTWAHTHALLLLLKRLHTCGLESSAESDTYSSLSALQYITNDSSTPLYHPEGWRNLPNRYRYLSLPLTPQYLTADKGTAKLKALANEIR